MLLNKSLIKLGIVFFVAIFLISLEFLYQNPHLLLPLASISVFFAVNLASRLFNFPRPEIEKPTPTGKNFKQKLAPYIRKIIYSVTIIWSIFLYFIAISRTSIQTLQLLDYQRHLGLTSIFMFFIVLSPGLIRVYFPKFSLNGLLIYSRRAIGVSTFYFALFHSLLSFLVYFSGSLAAIFSFPFNQFIAILFSTAALAILSLMASTSFDTMVKKLGFKRWKLLHRFVYVAIILVLFHAFLIGSNFGVRTSPYPLTVNFLALSYVLLETNTTFKMFRKTS